MINISPKSVHALSFTCTLTSCLSFIYCNNASIFIVYNYRIFLINSNYFNKLCNTVYLYPVFCIYVKYLNFRFIVDYFWIKIYWWIDNLRCKMYLYELNVNMRINIYKNLNIINFKVLYFFRILTFRYLTFNFKSFNKSNNLSQNFLLIFSQNCLFITTFAINIKLKGFRTPCIHIFKCF